VRQQELLPIGFVQARIGEGEIGITLQRMLEDGDGALGILGFIEVL
jgi:hypothetical protein